MANSDNSSRFVWTPADIQILVPKPQIVTPPKAEKKKKNG